MLLVLFSHGKNYLRAAGLGGVYDDPYIALQNHLDQLIVAMFLFYSGFGMMEQIQKRGLPYVKSIISLRLPKLLLNFDVAVLLFAAANLLMRKSIPLKRFLLSLVAIESLGNSNWYVFIVLVLYLFCYISFIHLYRKAIPERRTVFICLLTFTLLSVALVYIQIILHRPKYWYNTLILFSLGFYYSFFHRAIEKILMRNDISYLLAAVLLLAVYVFAYQKRWSGIEFYTIWAACFTALIVLFTMKVSINSYFLRYLGQHVFSIYIMQHLPVMVLFAIPFFHSHKYWFLVCSYLAVLPLSLCYEHLTGKLNRLIWKRAS